MCPQHSTRIRVPRGQNFLKSLCLVLLLLYLHNIEKMWHGLGLTTCLLNELNICKQQLGFQGLWDGMFQAEGIAQRPLWREKSWCVWENQSRSTGLEQRRRWGEWSKTLPPKEVRVKKNGHWSFLDPDHCLTFLMFSPSTRQGFQLLSIEWTVHFNRGTFGTPYILLHNGPSRICY